MSPGNAKVPCYRSYVFDCDGVVLDSNRLKTEAFRLAAMPYGAEAAEALVTHHVANGGISRFAKFRHFLDEIVGDESDAPALDRLLEDYAEAVREGLLRCGVAAGLADLRKRTADARWMIVSGGSQEELRAVFAERGLDALFDGGIFGSPDTKEEILAREIASGNIRRPGVFIGDSVYDHRSATGAGLDFVFATYWTEVEGWASYVAEHRLATVAELAELGNAHA